MELNELGVGSIVTVGDNIYRKNGSDWVRLVESYPYNLENVQKFEVIASVEKGPLDDFVKGDIISFESDYGRRIALKHRADFWSITGMVGEMTSEELLEYYAVVPDSARKVGSLDGRG